MRRNITSTDIAKLAKVSQSTVSRAFMPNAYIDKKKKERVLEISAKFGYKPNAIAASLASRSSRIICLVVAYLDNLFYVSVLEELSHSLEKEGYCVLLFVREERSQNSDDLLSEILRYSVDGIVMASTTLSSTLAQRCRKLAVPVVLLNRRIDDPLLSSVTSDNFGGGKKIAQHFAECGYRRVAFLAGNEQSSTNRDRERGFVVGAENLGIKIVARGVGNYDCDMAEVALKKMLTMEGKGIKNGSLPLPFEAIFVANDHMALRVMEVLRYQLGIAVPADVGVAGYDDVPMAAWPSFSLTTVVQDATLMAKKCVKLLLAQLSTGNISTVHELLEGELIARGSTDHKKPTLSLNEK